MWYLFTFAFAYASDLFLFQTLLAILTHFQSILQNIRSMEAQLTVKEGCAGVLARKNTCVCSIASTRQQYSFLYRSASGETSKSSTLVSKPIITDLHIKYKTIIFYVLFYRHLQYLWGPNNLVCGILCICLKKTLNILIHQSLNLSQLWTLFDLDAATFMKQGSLFTSIFGRDHIWTWFVARIVCNMHM